MTRILIGAKVLVFASLAFLLISLGIGVNSARHGATALTAKTALTLDGVNAAAANLNAALVTINRPCKGGDCGTLAGISLATHEVLVTTGQVEIVARHEKERIDVLDRQEDQIYADTHRTLGSANATLLRFTGVMDTADKTIAGLQPVEVQATATIASVNELMPNLAKTTENVTAMTDSGKNILADGAYETHKLTHPNKKTGFWAGFWVTVELLKPPLF